MTKDHKFIHKNLIFCGSQDMKTHFYLSKLSRGLEILINGPNFLCFSQQLESMKAIADMGLVPNIGH